LVKDESWKSTRIIPGDRGKIGSGWLVRSLKNGASAPE
jgi:hypothetical protein